MRKVLSVLIFFTLPSCYGEATPGPEAPNDTSSEESSSDTEDMAKDESDEATDEESSEDESTSEDTSASDKGSSSEASNRTAKSLLTQEGTVFMYTFSKSEAGEKADERCDKASGGDQEKKAKCVSKAAPKSESGIRFVKGNDGEWYFVRFEVKNRKPIEHNHVKAEFGEDSGKKITIKTSGPDEARARKGNVPASFEIEVPDDYTVIIDEPGRGKSVYETKLGLFDEG